MQGSLYMTTTTGLSFTGDKMNSLSQEEADLFLLTQNIWYKEPVKIADQVKSSSGNGDDIFNLQGTVVNRKKEPVKDIAITLMSNNNAVIFLMDTTDENGRFTFRLPEYNDSTQFNLQLTNLKGARQDYDCLIDTPAFPRFATPLLLKKIALAEDAEFTRKIKTNHIDSVLIGTGKEWLPPVTVKTKDFKNKVGSQSDVITKEMLQSGGFNNAGQAVLHTGKFHIVGRYLLAGGPNAFGPSALDEPIVILDGVQMTLTAGEDATETSPVLSFLKTLSIREIESIRVLSGAEAGIYGVRGGHGAIEIRSSTRIGSTGQAIGLKTIYPKGFYAAPSFNIPDYDNNKIRDSKTPDLRHTIYWNGDIVTNNSGKFNVDFYSADTPTTYLVTITGVTAKGDIIYKTTTIERK